MDKQLNNAISLKSDRKSQVNNKIHIDKENCRASRPLKVNKLKIENFSLLHFSHNYDK